MRLFLLILYALSFILRASENTPEGFDTQEWQLVQKIHQKITAKKQEEFLAYQEKTSKKSSIKMLPINEGKFLWQGKEKNDTLEVELSAFWMAEREVTWEDYKKFMFSKIPRDKEGQIPKHLREKQKEISVLVAAPTVPYMSMTYGMIEKKHPAISMTQHAANKYCQWLSAQTGHFYRLPTEAEWEYAARAGEKEKDLSAKGLCDFAWFRDNSQFSYHSPKQKKPNAWGFYDMQGNAQEWCLDQFVKNRQKYFKKDAVKNPWVKAIEPYPHVCKGGHWDSEAKDLKVSSRQASSEEWKAADPQFPKSLWYHTNTPWLGFRIIRPKKIPTAKEMYLYWNSGVEYD